MHTPQPEIILLKYNIIIYVATYKIIIILKIQNKK